MLVVNVSDTEVSLSPGGRITVEVSITNTSSRVEHYVTEAVQLPDGVTVVSPPASCQLSPGKHGTVQVTLAARTSPPPRVGTSLIGLRVVSPHRLEIQRTEELRLLVEARPDLALSVTPASVTGRRRAPVAVRIDNKGNAPLDVQVTGTSDDGKATLVWKAGPVATSPSGRPGNAIVLPGSGVTLPAEATSRPRFLGREKRHRLQLQAQAQPVEGVTVGDKASVDFNQPPVLPQGVVPRMAALGGAGLVAAAMVVAAKIVAGGLGADPSPGSTPTPTVAAQDATPAPSAAASASPSAGASPSASASPSGGPSPSASGGAGATLVDFTVPPPGGKGRTSQELLPDAYPGVTLAPLPDASRPECVTKTTGLLWLLPPKGTNGYVAPGHAEVVDGKPHAVCQDAALKITFAAPASRVNLSMLALADAEAKAPLAAYQVTVEDASGPQAPTLISRAPGQVASQAFADTSGKGILALVVQPVQAGRGVWMAVNSVTVEPLA